MQVLSVCNESVRVLQVHTGEATRSGMLGYKYTFKDDALDNGKVNKDNKCFCRKGNCLPEGLIDVTDCYYGEWPTFCSYTVSLLWRAWTSTGATAHRRRSGAVVVRRRNVVWPDAKPRGLNREPRTARTFCAAGATRIRASRDPTERGACFAPRRPNPQPAAARLK